MTKRTTGPRRSDTYRGYLRNKQFGRKPKGNTKPYERRAIWARELRRMGGKS